MQNSVKKMSSREPLKAKVDYLKMLPEKTDLIRSPEYFIEFYENKKTIICDRGWNNFNSALIYIY